MPHDRNFVFLDVLYPEGKFVGVGDRGRKAQQAHGFRSEDNRLLPHRAAFLVRQVVDFVEYDVRHPVELLRAQMEHVPEYLSGHDQDLRSGVDRHIPGDYAHIARAQESLELLELLVAQSLDGRGVYHPLTLVEHPLNQVVGDKRFAHACGRRHQHRPPLVQMPDSFYLERIQLETAVFGLNLVLARGMLHQLPALLACSVFILSIPVQAVWHNQPGG